MLINNLTIKVFLISLITLSIFFNLYSISLANIKNENNNIPTIIFMYDEKTDTYQHITNDLIIAGKKVKIIYDLSRKEVLFKYSSVIYMRYSFDFWKTCQDSELKFDKNGKLSTIISVPEYATTLQIAFFATYPYDNYKYWGYIWDSNYGNNFTINIVTKKEIKQKEKFDLISKLQ